MSTEMKPVFVVGGLYSLANGVAWIMRDLAVALGRLGAPVTVCGAECWGRGAGSIGHIFDPPSQWVSAKGLWLGGLSWSPALRWRMRDIIHHSDIVHNHSLWMLPNSYGSRIAARQHKPVLITAHGALESWALNHSRMKKRIVEQMFQRRDLLRADCLHVNSAAEVQCLRDYGLKTPVAIIPNGVALAALDQPASRDLIEDRFPELRDKRLVLFMARLHRKKGLEHLLEAWAILAARFCEWHLVVAGPDRGFEESARRVVQQRQLSSRVTFTGPLMDELARSARNAAEVFVQPSFSEGFSMAILEAMAAGCPVLISPGCNFPEVAEAGAGVIVDPDRDSTIDGLTQLLSLSTEERAAMAARGRQLIEQQYTWDTVAGKTLELYRWMCSGERRPEFVVG